MKPEVKWGVRLCRTPGLAALKTDSTTCCTHLPPSRACPSQ
uniref:Uncharacterized protein n=1 Tax=Anguilla anguilla TaxID=7936 RepID=A0A0E9T4G3_ANGAN